MKGKFRILGRSVLGAFLVCALMLAVIPALPVAAEGATAVTEVYVDFPMEESPNKADTADNPYIIHFVPATALVRGVDSVTVTFPDGSTTMGPAAFTAITGDVSSTECTFSTDYGTAIDTTDISTDGPTWKRTTSASEGGYRVKVLTPIDIAAGTDVWLKIDSAAVTAAATAGTTYKVYVSTTKDTTRVLSSAFTLGDAAPTDTAMNSSYPIPSTAGGTAAYVIEFQVGAASGNLTASTGKITVKFPVGMTLPSSISATDVSFSNDNSAYSPCPEAPTVNANTREVTAVTPIACVHGATTYYMKIAAGAGITNPTLANDGTYQVAVRTSIERRYDLAAGYWAVTAGSATKVLVANGEIGLSKTTKLHSDDATMVNMYSSQLYITLADQYGNAKYPGSSKTVNLSSPTGTFFKAASGTSGSGVAMSSADSITIGAADPNTNAQIVYYKNSSAGTHTLTFSDSGGTYTSATWTFTVCPGVSVYDSSDNLIKTYGATTTTTSTETGTTSAGETTYNHSGDFINNAITGAMTGDTVKLGDGTYELDTVITLSKKVTLTSVNGASSTTLRNTATTFDKGINVTTGGTATNPIIIDGFTFQRLRSGITFERAVYNDGYDYLTVRNCIFNYIEPDVEFDSSVSGGVIIIGNNDVAGAITSATVSNNTFNNCCTTWPDLGSGAKAAAIGIIARYQHDTSSDTGYPITGVTVSGNTLTNCGGIGIDFNGYAGHADHNPTYTYVTGSITNNTITNGYSCIQVERNSTSVTVTGNTITGAYSYGVKLCGTTTTAMTIKNNTITNTVGDSNGAGIRIQTVTNVVPAVQYNDVTGSNTYAIKADSVAATNCKYNWYGDASGPNYTALTGASVGKSNPNGTGDKITDYVTYYPWLHKSRADVVNDNVSYQTSTMKLVSGWNTLSTPVKLIATADSIDELIPSGMTIGYYYDATATVPGWQQITTGYVLDACDAVYVKMLSAKYVQFKFDAGAWTMPSKDLAVGWNLVGLAYLASGGMDADEAAASVYKTAANLPGYSQVIGPSLIDVQTDLYGSTSCASFAYSSGETSNDANMMYAGLGYWVYMQNAATLAGFTITPIAPDLD